MKIKKGFMNSIQLMYCGMPNENTFVITPLLAQGYGGFSPSLYYNCHDTLIHILEDDYTVVDVNSKYIILRTVER